MSWVESTATHSASHRASTPARTSAAPSKGAPATAPVTPAQAAQSQREAVEHAIPKPGLFAPGWESEYRKGVVSFALGDYAEAVKHFRQASTGDSKNASDDLFLAFSLSKTGAEAESIPLLEKVVASGIALPDKLQEKYCQATTMIISTEIVPGLKVDVPFDGSGAALLLAEHYQEAGRLDDAIDLIEGLGEAGFDAELVALSLAELHSAKSDWAAVIRVTDGLANIDDITAAALSYRSAALRETGLFDAALEVSREALTSQSRSKDVLLGARYQKARALEAQGKKRMAQKEYEVIEASQSTYADVAARIAALQAAPDKS
jgi:tetratricopeptide (TPR) repeat protein